MAQLENQDLKLHQSAMHQLEAKSQELDSGLHKLDQKASSTQQQVTRASCDECWPVFYMHMLQVARLEGGFEQLGLHSTGAVSQLEMHGRATQMHEHQAQEAASATVLLPILSYWLTCSMLCYRRG